MAAPQKTMNVLMFGEEFETGGALAHGKVRGNRREDLRRRDRSGNVSLSSVQKLTRNMILTCTDETELRH